MTQNFRSALVYFAPGEVQYF